MAVAVGEEGPSLERTCVLMGDPVQRGCLCHWAVYIMKQLTQQFHPSSAQGCSAICSQAGTTIAILPPNFYLTTLLCFPQITNAAPHPTATHTPIVATFGKVSINIHERML